MQGKKFKHPSALVCFYYFYGQTSGRDGEDGKGYKAICGRIRLPLLRVVSHHGRERRRRGGGHQEDAIYATDADTDERTERSGRFTFLAPSSRRRYMNALQPEKEKGEEAQQDGITIHREVLNKEDLDC